MYHRRRGLLNVLVFIISADVIITNNSNEHRYDDMKLYDVINSQSYQSCIFDSSDSKDSIDVMDLISDKPCSFMFLLDYFNLPAVLLTDQILDYQTKTKIRNCSKNQLEIILLQNSNFTAKQDHTFFDASYVVFISFCSASCTSKLLDIASNFDIIGSKHTWIILRSELVYTLSKVPENLITLTIGDCFHDALHSMFDHKEIESSVKLSEKSTTNTSRTSTLDIAVVRSSENLLPKSVTIATYENNNLIRYLQFESILSTFPKVEDSNMIFNVVTIIESPFTMIQESVKYDPIDQTCDNSKVCWIKETNGTYLPHCCVGYCMDLLERFEQDLKMKTKVYLVEDSSYGAKVNGSWTGMVGDIVRKKADLVVAALTINAKRAQVVDYTETYLVGGVGIATIMNKKNLPFVNSKAFEVLTAELWLSIYALVFFTATIMVMAKKILGGNEQLIPLYFDALYYIFGLMFQREIGGCSPSFSLSFGVIAVSISLFMLVAMTTYTAALTAKKVTDKNSLPIIGFNDEKIVKPRVSFTYGTINNSAFTQMFQDSMDPDWNRMYHFMRSYNFLDTDAAFEKLKRGELNAIIHDYPVIFHHIAKDRDCSIHFAGEPIKDAGYGIAVQKGSVLKERITNLIRIYNNDGFLIRLSNKWISSSCTNTEIQSEYEATGVDYFGSLFLLLLCSILLSIIIFIIEHCVSWDRTLINSAI